MTSRQFRILATLVNAYVEDGEPVSSGWVAEHCALGLSPATVRSILASLEEQGLVRQPHTSAGRIPTDLGYRLYVDSLLGARRRARGGGDVEARLRRSGTVSDLLETASQELSRASHQIGFALAPASTGARLQHIDFVPLDGARVLVIIVAVGGVVTHKVIDTEERCSPATLSQAANYVNSEFGGLTLHEVREAILQRLSEERQLYDELVRRALTLARSGLDQVHPPELLFVQGASYLVGGLVGDAEDRQHTLETLRLLLHMIEEKHQLVDLLTRSIEASGITVVIGSEHRSPDLRSFSLVASTFQDGNRTGTVGVIGPTRMRYQRAISVVDVISQAVERVLEGQ